MIDYFLTVFSDPSDQARLIIVLLSTTVAILILLINQNFINRRERRKLLIEKIELLYSTSQAYSRTSEDLVDSLISHPTFSPETNFDAVVEKRNTLMASIEDRIRTMDMLFTLYFPKEDLLTSEYLPLALPIANKVYHLKPGDKMTPEEIDTIDRESYIYISILHSRLVEIVRRLIDKEMHSYTSRVTNYALSKVRR